MGELITAFGLGNTAILNNVCLLPLYPGLVAFLAGNAGADQKRTRMGMLGALVLAGVLTMMVLVAFLLFAFNAVTDDILPILLPVIYGIVILLGGLMLAGYNPWSRIQMMQAPVFKNRLVTAYTYGLLLGPMTLPCVAPLIVTAFALGANDAAELLDGILYFLAFGLGFGWPLVALPLVAVQSQRRFIGWMTKNHTLLTRLSGVLLLAIGMFGFATEVIPNWLEEDVQVEDARWSTGSLRQDHTEPVNALVFSADSSQLISAGGIGNSGLFSTGQDFAFRIWKVSGGTPQIWANAAANSTEALAVSPDGKLLASGGWENQVAVYNAETGAPIIVLVGHTTRIQALAFSPDGSRLAAGSEDGLVQVWAVADNTITQPPMLTFTHPRLSSLAFSPDGALLATGSLDTTIKIWESTTGEEISTLSGHSGWVNALAFHPTRGQVASASEDGTIHLWDVAGGETTVILSIAGQTAPLNAVVFSPNGRFLAVGGGDQVVVWETDNYTRPAITFREHETPVLTLAFSPDGGSLASGDQAGIIYLRQTPDK